MKKTNSLNFNTIHHLILNESFCHSKFPKKYQNIEISKSIFSKRRRTQDFVAKSQLKENSNEKLKRNANNLSNNDLHNAHNKYNKDFKISDGKLSVSLFNNKMTGEQNGNTNYHSIAQVENRSPIHNKYNLKEIETESIHNDKLINLISKKIANRRRKNLKHIDEEFDPNESKYKKFPFKNEYYYNELKSKIFLQKQFLKANNIRKYRDKSIIYGFSKSSSPGYSLHILIDNVS